MKGVYLGACIAYIPGYDIVYNDIIQYEHVSLCCDMLSVDLSSYDYILASPPCNFWSRANYRRFTSEYSQKTKHLLPSVLLKCVGSDKPFIVENVRNFNMFKQYGIIDICEKNGIFIYEYGRHTYFTNCMLNLNNIMQVFDNISKKSGLVREGGFNVNIVFKYFIDFITS